MPFECEECTNLGARLVFGLDIRLCKGCKKLFKYRLISKTHALKDYGLKQNDIDNLEYKEVGNPLYRGERNMILYKESDILNIFIKKYYTLIGHNEINILERPDENPNFRERINNILEFYKANLKNIKLDEKKFNF